MVLALCQFDATNDAGDILTNVTVEVRLEDTLALITPYSDRAGTVALGNPFISTDGKIAFFAAGGAYRIVLTAGSYSRTLRYVKNGLAAESDGAVGGAVVGNLSVEGYIEVNHPSGDSRMFLNKPATDGLVSSVVGRRGGLARWEGKYGNGTGETGAGVGSDYELDNYDDAGVLIGTAMKIMRASGIMQLPNAPMFHAYGGSTIGTPYTTIIPASTALNNGSHYDITTGRFTAPEDGVYLAGYAGLMFPHATGSSSLRFTRSGVPWAHAIDNESDANNHSVSGFALIEMTKGQYFSHEGKRNSGSTANPYSGQWNFFGGKIA